LVPAEFEDFVQAMKGLFPFYFALYLAGSASPDDIAAVPQGNRVIEISMEIIVV